MSENMTKFAKTAKDLSRNPLGIIALFIVLVYGFACEVGRVYGVIRRAYDPTQIQSSYIGLSNLAWFFFSGVNCSERHLTTMAE